MARILVVDDEDAIRTMLRQVLASEGYQVQVACDGQEALDHWAAAPPDLILLDLNMPRVPGWEVCRQIKAQSTIPIIIMTGQTATEGAAAEIAQFADGYLLKPFPFDTLLPLVRHLLTPAYTAIE